MSGYPGGGQDYDDGYGQRGQGNQQHNGADSYYQDNDQYYHDNNGYDARGGQQDGYYDESYVHISHLSMLTLSVHDC